MNAVAPHPSVLIVDDEPLLRNSLFAILNTHGYMPATADGGASALNALQDGKYELMLLDLCMPGIDGHQVMEWMGQHRIDTCVMVISGDVSIDSAINALRHGACDYLRKPYEIDELLLRIEKALSRRKLEQEHRSVNQRLRDSERWYRYMVNSSPDFIYTLDAEGVCTFCNDRVQSLLGYSKESMIGKPLTAFIYPEDLEAAQYILQEKRSGDRGSGNVEIRIPHGIDSTLLTLEFNSFGMYEESEAGLPSRYVGVYGVAKDITEKKKNTDLIIYQVYHDQLTGLANRKLFKDHLELAIAQARRHQHMLALMFLDLDRFKVVNDTLGHAVGDRLLIEVAVRLKGCLREDDTLARLGGDEFTLLLPHISHRENAIRAADKIIQAFAAPFQIDGHELHVPMSIGIALYPEHGDSMDVLIKNADIAMYDSKAKGRNQFQIYDAEMSVSFDERFSLEMQMRKALEKEEFQVFYQPQVDLATGRISGMEALVRWLSPLRGYMLPAEFIPLAEETGLIVPIGEFVIRSVFRQAKLWKEAGLMPPRIAINLSSRHLEQAQLVGFIADLLQEYELPGSRFEIEITENTLLNDGEHILEKLKQLSEMGIRIALDDFGTGYSSLGYLKKFPIDTIKIDQSFMPRFSGDSDNESIVTAICTLAKSLDLRLIAEGVEKADQYQWLHQLNCNEAQGFLFSKPLASKDITDLLINKPPFSPTWT